MELPLNIFEQIDTLRTKEESHNEKLESIDAFECFQKSYNQGAYLDNVFLHLLLGQYYYELGKIKKAKEHLFSSYTLVWE
ncbi:MAG: hypothetical protein JXR51_11195 [Bacteroidales bacterium]|nr:hypothetical protein [Bacteroidales bacterium]MBN2757735.1 hypothetical protein [Bacteroidales bacterium]